MTWTSTVVSAVLFADGDHFGPALGLQLAADRLDLLDRGGAIGIVEADHVHADALDVADQLGGFGLLPGRDAGGEFQHGRGKVDLDELAFRGRHQLADIDGIDLGLSGIRGGRQRQRQRRGGKGETNEVFHNDGFWKE